MDHKTLGDASSGDRTNSARDLAGVNRAKKTKWGRLCPCSVEKLIIPEKNFDLGQAGKVGLKRVT